MPSSIPTLLINGSEGIGWYGYQNTTAQPYRLVDGIVALIDNKTITIEELMSHIKGPLSTAGLILGVDGLKDYETGRGR